jgi:hypothetical protein
MLYADVTHIRDTKWNKISRYLRTCICVYTITCNHMHIQQFNLESSVLPPAIQRDKKIRQPMTLFTVLYGCKTWVFYTQIRHRMKMFENRMLWGTCRTKWQKPTGVRKSWMELHMSWQKTSRSAKNVLINENRYIKHNYLYCVRLFYWATSFDPTCGSSSGLYIDESLKSCACWDPFMLT